MLKIILDYLDRQSTVTLAVGSTVLAGLIGLLDYLTGYQISFGVFYLIPVSIAAWYVGNRYGITMAGLTATVWLTANALSDPASDLTTAILVWNATTRLGFFLVTAVLVTNLRQALDREKSLARTDSLTGLLNSRAFEEAGNAEIERGRRYNYPLTLVYLDLDNFKSVNDRAGHHVGDQLLVEVARILRMNLRSSDFIGRVGGDEFVMLLPETGDQQAKKICKKIIAQIADGLQIKGWPVTCSLGAITVNGGVPTIKMMLSEADRLMYKVKRTGKKAYLVELFASDPPVDLV